MLNRCNQNVYWLVIPFPFSIHFPPFSFTHSPALSSHHHRSRIWNRRRRRCRWRCLPSRHPHGPIIWLWGEYRILCVSRISAQWTYSTYRHPPVFLCLYISLSAAHTHPSAHHNLFVPFLYYFLHFHFEYNLIIHRWFLILSYSLYFHFFSSSLSFFSLCSSSAFSYIFLFFFGKFAFLLRWGYFVADIVVVVAFYLKWWKKAAKL